MRNPEANFNQRIPKPLTMKKWLLLFLNMAFFNAAISQVPDYYYYIPANAGVNNLYFNNSNSYKFLFIYTQAELAATGIAGPFTISSIWLKSNTAYPLTIGDLNITMGHSSLAAPTPVFADNFDTGIPSVVLSEPSYALNMIASTWNDPPSGWTEIPLSAPFFYNGSDNLVVEVTYSSINYPIPLFADNGGAPVTQLSSIPGSSVADATTARPMLGLSGSQSPVAFSSSDSSVCEKFCISFTDFSANNPQSWQWFFPGGIPSSSTQQNPSSICYNVPGIYSVTLITSDSAGSDTLVRPDFITVYPTPSTPVITINGNELISTVADNYQWQLNFIDIAGATSQSYTASQSGAYTVVISDLNGCTASTTIDFSLTGIDNFTAGEGLSFYPNPSAGKINLLVNGKVFDSNLLIEIKNVAGHVVYSSTSEDGGRNAIGMIDAEIDLDEEPSGIYLLQVSSTQNHHPFFAVKKIILLNE
jgi:PKD repeat protein